MPCTMVLYCDACWDEWELPADSERLNSSCSGGNLRECHDSYTSYEFFYPCSCGEEDVYCSHCFRKWERRWEDTRNSMREEWRDDDASDASDASDDASDYIGMPTHDEAMRGIIGFMQFAEYAESGEAVLRAAGGRF